MEGVGDYQYPGSWGGGEAPPMATSTLTGRNPTPIGKGSWNRSPTPVQRQKRAVHKQRQQHSCYLHRMVVLMMGKLGLIYVHYFLLENAAVQHSLRSLFFLQYNTHSVLYFYSTHSFRSLFFLQYNTHSVLYSTTLTPFSKGEESEGTPQRPRMPPPDSLSYSETAMLE